MLAHCSNVICCTCCQNKCLLWKGQGKGGAQHFCQWCRLHGELLAVFYIAAYRAINGIEKRSMAKRVSLLHHKMMHELYSSGLGFCISFEIQKFSYTHYILELYLFANSTCEQLFSGLSNISKSMQTDYAWFLLVNQCSSCKIKLT